MVVTQTNLPGIKAPFRGKVRDVYDLGELMLIVATDRLSAFDVVLPDPIPDKGRVLTQLAAYWFNRTKDKFPNHLITTEVKDFPAPFRDLPELLQGRSMLVRKGRVLPVECVVRGYLAGSGWQEYRRTGKVHGHLLPDGLRESDRLPEPLFTPTTKATTGHDLPMTWEELVRTVGQETAEQIRAISLALYREAARQAEEAGIIIADTKFEFAWIDNQLTVVDEIFTPDSSRFWPLDGYCPGQAQPSFDKQYIRDYLESIGWDKQPPAPALPPEVIAATRENYLEAYRRITGHELSPD